MPKSSKQILLEAAVDVFSEHGYRDAKIADIADRAKANIAAVNYHFGSKENLFISALRQAFTTANDAHPMDGNLPSSATPREKITAFVRAILKRSFDPGPASNFNKIMCRTVHVPGSPIERILIEMRELEMDYLESTLANFLPHASPQTLALAKVNLISLATVASKHPFFLHELIDPKASQHDITSFIDTQTSITLAALEAHNTHPSIS